MTRFTLSACGTAVALSLVGCQATSAGSNVTVTTTAPSPSATTAPIEQSSDVLQLALTIHVERYPTEVRDQAEFTAHIAVLEQLAELATSYDVILNFELSSEFVEAVDIWQSDFIEEMSASGHGIAQHSGDQTTAGLTGNARVAELVRQREAIEAHGVTVNYASGGCSADDWVEAATAAGLSAITGNVEYCLKSLDDESLPAGMEWIRRCNNQAICHDPLYVGTARVLHPWTTSSSATWLVDDPDGALVVVASDDVAALVAMSKGGELNVDLLLQEWVEMLDEYVAATVAGQVNVLNMTLSVGPVPDWELLESMFSQALVRQQAGQLSWSNLSDVVAQAVAEAATQPADVAVVYTDTTPDLGGGL